MFRCFFCQRYIWICELEEDGEKADNYTNGHVINYSMEDYDKFRKVRKIKNEITTEEAKELLRNNKRAAFSVNGDDGYPYTIPINFYYDEEENKIYFHGAKKGHKIDSIKKNDKVCLTTWNDGYVDDGDWAYHVSSCVIFGRARLVDDIRITEEKIRKFALKYYPSAEEVEEEIKIGIKGVQLVEIEIEHISGKKVHEK